MTGPQVIQLAAEALLNASSVHVTGTGMVDGQQGAVSMELTPDARRIEMSSGNQSMHVITIGNTAYIKANKGFWQSQLGASATPAMLHKLADRWVKSPKPASELKMASAQGLADEMRNPPSPIDDEVTEEVVDGQPVVLVSEADGSTIYVSESSPHYPVKIVDTGDEPSTSILIYDQPINISAPPSFLDVASSGSAG